MLKPFLVVSAAILFEFAALTPPAVVAAGSPQQPPAAAPANTAKSTPASRERAKKLYTMDCALCHGDNGNGKTDLAKDMQLTIADWTDPKTLENRSDQELYNVIRNGKDKMPSEDESRAKKDEVYALIAYIREISKNQPAPAAPAADATTPPPPADATKPNR
ncbi:MAG: cytochrome c [Terracidiphilus sp.]|jgi:cytochrome c5